MQLDTQKHEVSQYLRSAHANRHAEARVSRCMNTKHAERQVDMEVSYGMARRHATGHVDAHVSPRMRPEACETTHMRSGGMFLLAGNFYIYLATLHHFYSSHSIESKAKLPKDCPEVKEGSFQVLISPDQAIQDIDVGFIGDGFRARKSEPRGGSSSSCMSLLPQMPPANPIEDQGTAIPIEDRDRTILERLRLGGVIVKGNPGTLSETSSCWGQKRLRRNYHSKILGDHSNQTNQARPLRNYHAYTPSGRCVATKSEPKLSRYEATELESKLGRYVATELEPKLSRYVATELEPKLGRYVAIECSSRSVAT
ncbi:hypothetical protein F2Q68_00003770 [Brassica cretica]|uniref:Uncharacterized protein n=1 Tax=Brassica cretica TaxID=69181 RepID=A0A8S9JIL9_BRACR|nr:hypothetical protein F2Q68_00003770 [Brassica cretica]